MNIRRQSDIARLSEVMKKINYRAVMMVASPMIASVYTILAVWMYVSDAHPEKQCVWTVCSAIWWVCSLLWACLYYADKKFKAHIASIKEKINSAQRELNELLRYRAYFCEYIGRELTQICTNRQLTAQDIADALGFRAAEVESVIAGELNAMPDHINKILAFLCVDQQPLEEAANEYAKTRMNEEKHPS